MGGGEGGRWGKKSKSVLSCLWRTFLILSLKTIKIFCRFPPREGESYFDPSERRSIKFEEIVNEEVWRFRFLDPGERTPWVSFKDNTIAAVDRKEGVGSLLFVE